jgi:DNA-directed RNA polymerase III subunit RPC6
MEEVILNILNQSGKIQDSVLNQLISHQTTLNLDEKLEAINSLLSKGKISVFEEGGEAFFQSLTETQSAQMRNLEGTSMLILQLVREAGDKGTSNQELKQKTQIPIAQISKVLTALEKKGLVFAQKSVNQNKKMWFVEGTKPNSGVTGGFLFADSEFDRNLMNDLCSQVKVLLSDKPCSLKDVLEYLKSNFNKNIEESNAKDVLQSMIALGEVEEKGGKFKAVKDFLVDPLVLPCFACRLRFECRPDGVVNPAECEYLNSWLEF